MYETGQIRLRLSDDRKRFTFEGNYAPGDWTQDHAQLIYDALCSFAANGTVRKLDPEVQQTYVKLTQEIEQLAHGWNDK